MTEIEITSGKKPTVCFLGPVSSYSHQATLQAFSQDNYEFMPVVTIKDIFDTTNSGAASLGVVPFENSSNGSVIFTLDCFADRQDVYGDLNVCGEIYLDVHHCLLGFFPPPDPIAKASASSAGTELSPDASGTCTPTPGEPNPSTPRSKPLTSLKHIKRVYSHPQAFGQCSTFLNTYLKGVETIDVSSTSKAAQLVAEESTSEGATAAAAISSAIAADMTGLQVLGRNIEDMVGNCTRFLVVRKGHWQSFSPKSVALPKDSEQGARRASPSEPLHTEQSDLSVAASPTKGTKSLISFTIPHDVPGALTDVLAGFGRAGLNLTSIYNRPTQREPFQYIHFIEFEGHRYLDPDGKVAEALKHVEKVASSWQWLGSWESRRVKQ